MRNPSKGTAACWDCKFYKVIGATPDHPYVEWQCLASGTPERIAWMRMKCDDKVKSK